MVVVVVVMEVKVKEEDEKLRKALVPQEERGSSLEIRIVCIWISLIK